jgi:branched-chain amino acid transport system ATP-binding protein
VTESTPGSRGTLVEPAREAGGPILAVRNLEVVYQDVVLVLRGVSLEVPRGEIVALLGANGAGKTTTIRAISGLLRLHSGRMLSGSVELQGAEISKLRANKIVSQGVAQVPEGRMVFAELTVEENLRIGATARKGGYTAEDIDRVFELFPSISSRRGDQAGWLSGGEQQMVAIGRGLMANPRLLLLDEVSLGLAPIITRSIFERLREVRVQYGTSMLVVEQNARLALEFCDYAYILDTGRIVLEGPAAQLRADAQVQELYLGGEIGEAERSFATAKRYRRRRRWLT